MIKNLTFKFMGSILQEIKYFKIIVKFFIIFFSFFLFLFFEDVLQEEFLFCCFSFFMTAIISAFFFMSQERKLVHRFTCYFHSSYLMKKQEREVHEFRKKLYLQNIKRYITELFLKLEIKSGYFGLLQNKLLFFYYDTKKIQVLSKKGDLVNKKLIQFLHSSRDYFHNFQESDNNFKTTLESLKANSIISLRFQDQLVGFLIFNNVQKKFFQNIKAVEIQESSILFYNLVSNEVSYKDDKFKNELKKSDYFKSIFEKFSPTFHSKYKN